MSGVLVGIDVGGSKTAIRALTTSGTLVVDATQPTERWRGETWAAKARILVDGIAATVPEPILALAIGAHGCDTDDQCRALERELREELNVPVRVVNDAQLLGHAAGLPKAVGLIAGTGAIAAAVTSDGRAVHAGGWGWLLGDDGGATGIVRETVRAGLQAVDRGTPDVLLERALAGAASVSTLGDVGFGMMLRRPEDWATLAGTVFVAAGAGSPVAAEVIERAAVSLTSLVTAVGRLGAPLDDVVLGGGVVRGQSQFAERVAHLVRAAHPGTTVTILREAPVIGAVHLARSLLVPTPDRMHHPIP